MAHTTRFEREYAKRTKGFEIHSVGDEEDRDEFSWRQCDTCGSTFGGARTRCVLTNPGTNKRGRRRRAIEVSSCDDCVFFAANGDVPDDWRQNPRD